uniref:non-specific serine/threonine protein kinase n=1 Tax=Hirondellea gigas TaxID=1518452 RepID=A0A6A7FT80_9CRUS
MSSPECGVLASRGWTGGLSLSIPATEATHTKDNDPCTDNDNYNNATITNMDNSNNKMADSITSTDNSNRKTSSTNTISIENPYKATSNMSESAMTVSSASSQGNTAASNTGSAVGGTVRRGRASPAPVNRVPLVRQSEERRAKRCRFYRNGDRWFPGALLAVSTDRHRTWEALLVDVTRLLEHPLHLAAGVRFVFTLEGNKIDIIEELVDSGEYVASSNDAFKTIEYRAARLPQWRLHTRRREALHVPSSSRTTTAITPTFDDFNNLRPRLVTVLRNGQRPRKAVRVLLNRKTARALDQVMEDLSVSLKLDTGAVRKIYTLDGRQISSLKELFQDDDVFIACGLERCSRDDFYLDNEESRCIQLLLKGHGLPGVKKRMPSPKLRGRAISPLHSIDQTGSLPRASRLSRESPSSHRPSHHQHHISFPSTEELFLPAAITSRYRVGRILGDGNFAVVRECCELGSKRKFALKIIDKSKCQGKEEMIQSEVDILRKVSHENIVRLEEELQCPDFLYLVMELVTGGDLFDAIAAATRYTENEAGLLVRDLAAALEYLHQRNIVHRDVKPENLLVVPGRMPRLKLGDFGLAVQLTEPLYTICGTPTYVAPEILSEHGYGMEVDIWAAGVIAYILLCGFPPFISATNNQEELFEQILAGELRFPSPYWDHVTHNPRHLIAAMVLVEPDARYTAQQVLQHPWVMGYSDDQLTDQSYQYQEMNSYGDYNEMAPEDEQQEMAACVISDISVPPPEEEEQQQYIADIGVHRNDYDIDIQHNDEGTTRHYDYQHNAIDAAATCRLPPIGRPSTGDLGSNASSARRRHHRSKSPPTNYSYNSVSSSSGVDSYSSSNDNNKYVNNDNSDCSNESRRSAGAIVVLEQSTGEDSCINNDGKNNGNGNGQKVDESSVHSNNPRVSNKATRSSKSPVKKTSIDGLPGAASGSGNSRQKRDSINKTSKTNANTSRASGGQSARVTRDN